jgi:hypothetical protein
MPFDLFLHSDESILPALGVCCIDRKVPHQDLGDTVSPDGDRENLKDDRWKVNIYSCTVPMGRNLSLQQGEGIHIHLYRYPLEGLSFL